MARRLTFSHDSSALESSDIIICGFSLPHYSSVRLLITSSRISPLKLWQSHCFFLSNIVFKSFLFSFTWYKINAFLWSFQLIFHVTPCQHFESNLSCWYASVSCFFLNVKVSDQYNATLQSSSLNNFQNSYLYCWMHSWQLWSY